MSARERPPAGTPPSDEVGPAGGEGGSVGGARRPEDARARRRRGYGARAGARGTAGEASPEQAALEAALRLLAQRSRSRQELAAALERRGVAPEVQARVLARLEGLRYLDDARFAGERARALLERGRLGPEGVVHRLQAHGIPAEEARRAVEGAQAALGVDPLEAARRLLVRRGLAGRPLTPREQARAGRLLLARGYDEEEIHRLLRTSALDPSQDGD